MTKKELIKKGLRVKTIADADYFYVSEIKEKLPEMKIDTEQITFDAQENPIIKAEYIEPLTDFDNKINQSLLFNPKKK